MSRADRRAMVRRGEAGLSLSRQCRLLGLSRSSLYHTPAPVSAEDLALMAALDRIYLQHPFYGARRMVVALRAEGWRLGRKRVGRQMRLMGLEALYPRPNTSRPHEDHEIHPYLLRGLAIERPGQVWASDITYIPMRRGFLYLVAVMDWASRFVLAWRLCNSLEADFCVEALEEALACRRPPEIFNSDQGSQFTSSKFTGALKAAGVAISMDGKGCFMDNIFIERLWRSLKYEEVYLKAYDSVAEARAAISSWLGFYNEERPHQALGYRTPRAVFEEEKRPVDLMDNADALPTIPQAQQQKVFFDSVRGNEKHKTKKTDGHTMNAKIEEPSTAGL